MTTPENKRRRMLSTLRLVREGSFLAPDGYKTTEVRCSSPRTLFQFMRPYAEREEVEAFWIVVLNAQMHIRRMSPIVISRGTLNSSLVHPREVFRSAIYANAAGIIAVHNHPSGDPTPSVDDRMVTDQLVAAGKLLDIPLYDHIVIGEGRFVSFAESGLL